MHEALSAGSTCDTWNFVTVGYWLFNSWLNLLGQDEASDNVSFSHRQTKTETNNYWGTKQLAGVPDSRSVVQYDMFLTFRNLSVIFAGTKIHQFSVNLLYTPGSSEHWTHKYLYSEGTCSTLLWVRLAIWPVPPFFTVVRLVYCNLAYNLLCCGWGQSSWCPFPFQWHCRHTGRKEVTWDHVLPPTCLPVVISNIKLSPDLSLKHAQPFNC